MRSENVSATSNVTSSVPASPSLSQSFFDVVHCSSADASDCPFYRHRRNTLLVTPVDMPYRSVFRGKAGLCVGAGILPLAPIRDAVLISPRTGCQLPTSTSELPLLPRTPAPNRLSWHSAQSHFPDLSPLSTCAENDDACSSSGSESETAFSTPYEHLASPGFTSSPCPHDEDQCAPPLSFLSAHAKSTGQNTKHGAWRSPANALSSPASDVNYGEHAMKRRRISLGDGIVVDQTKASGLEGRMGQLGWQVPV